MSVRWPQSITEHFFDDICCQSYNPIAILQRAWDSVGRSCCYVSNRLFASNDQGRSINHILLDPYSLPLHPCTRCLMLDGKVWKLCNQNRRVILAKSFQEETHSPDYAVFIKNLDVVSTLTSTNHINEIWEQIRQAKGFRALAVRSSPARMDIWSCILSCHIASFIARIPATLSSWILHHLDNVMNCDCSSYQPLHR